MTLAKYPTLIKILFLFTLYIVHGRPFEGIGDYGYALLAAYLLLLGILRERVKPVLLTLGLTFLVVGHFVPQLMIPEQQRILMDDHRNLVHPAQFLKEPFKYPYFLTADGYVQGYKDKRFVTTIDIDEGIISLRSGWRNRMEYNFYAPDSPHVRLDLPFVVCYEIIPQMVGMTLNLEGLMVFDRKGALKIHDPALKTLKLQEGHVGSTLCGFGGQWDGTGYNNLKIKLEKTTAYKFYDAARLIASFLGLMFLFFGLFYIPLTVDFGVQSLLLAISCVFFWINYHQVLRWGIFAEGGMDGVVHDGHPHQMLEKWAAGDWGAALMSPEHVFYFMPGMRYVRFIETLLFGDAYIFQICLLIFVPVIFYRFFSVFLSRFISASLALLTFIFRLNFMGLSIKLYITTLLSLYGEGFAYALLLVAITILAKSIHKVGWGMIAFFLLGVSISIRPNLAIFVSIIGGVHLLSTTFSLLPWGSRFIMLFGLAPVLLIPIHNILGGEFVLLTRASQIPENLPLSPHLYFQAISHLFGFNESFNHSGRFVQHFYYGYRYIFAWALCIWLSMKGHTPVVRTFAFATFAGLSMHFFYMPDLRYIHPYLTITIALVLSQFLFFRAREQNLNGVKGV